MIYVYITHNIVNGDETAGTCSEIGGGGGGGGWWFC